MPDGGSYEGDFQYDNAEGIGTYFLPNEGLKYVGEVKNNVWMAKEPCISLRRNNI